MVKVKVLVDGFQIGMLSFNKGDETDLPLPAARYAISTGACKRVSGDQTPKVSGDETPKVSGDETSKVVTPKKRIPKKKAYLRRDVRAEK